MLCMILLSDVHNLLCNRCESDGDTTHPQTPSLSASGEVQPQIIVEGNADVDVQRRPHIFVRQKRYGAESPCIEYVLR